MASAMMVGYASLNYQVFLGAAPCYLIFFGFVTDTMRFPDLKRQPPGHSWLSSHSRPSGALRRLATRAKQ